MGCATSQQQDARGAPRRRQSQRRRTRKPDRDGAAAVGPDENAAEGDAPGAEEDAPHPLLMSMGAEVSSGAGGLVSLEGVSGTRSPGLRSRTMEGEVDLRNGCTAENPFLNRKAFKNNQFADVVVELSRRAAPRGRRGGARDGDDNANDNGGGGEHGGRRAAVNSFTTRHASNGAVAAGMVPARAPPPANGSSGKSAAAKAAHLERRRLRAIELNMTVARAARVRAFVDASDQGLSADLGPLLPPEDVAGHAARLELCRASGATPNFAACVRRLWQQMLQRRGSNARAGSGSTGASGSVSPSPPARRFSRCESPALPPDHSSSAHLSHSSSQAASSGNFDASGATLVTMHVGSSAEHTAVSSFSSEGFTGGSRFADRF
jgi:hypothetical protein